MSNEINSSEILNKVDRFHNDTNVIEIRIVNEIK